MKSLTERDLKILQSLYERQSMTNKEIAVTFFSDSVGYSSRRMYLLKQHGLLETEPITTGWQKSGSRYTLTQLGYQALQTRELPPNGLCKELVTPNTKIVRRIRKNIQDKENAELGYVYLIRYLNSFYSDLFKIGQTTDVRERIHSLKMSSGFEIEIVHTIATNDYKEIEYFLHKLYQDKKTIGEWFKLDLCDVQFIKSMTPEITKRLSETFFGKPKMS